jgi:hypothetical protein
MRAVLLLHARLQLCTPIQAAALALMTVPEHVTAARTYI